MYNFPGSHPQHTGNTCESHISFSFNSLYLFYHSYEVVFGIIQSELLTNFGVFNMNLMVVDGQMGKLIVEIMIEAQLVYPKMVLNSA